MLFFAVVGLVGQPEPGLGEVHQVAGRVLGVGVHIHRDTAAHPGALQGAEGGGQRVGVGRVVDHGQFVEQRAHAAPLDGLLVEKARIQVADALRVRVAGGRTPLAGLDDQVPHLLLGAVVQLPEGAVGGPVRRYLVFGQPAAVDVTEQVVLGADAVVYVAQVDARAEGRIRHPAILPSFPGATIGPCPRARAPSHLPKKMSSTPKRAATRPPTTLTTANPAMGSSRITGWRQRFSACCRWPRSCSG